MIVARTIAECRAARVNFHPVALVPTMGALHEGHRSLVEEGHRVARRVAVSIFVNPTQFGRSEDFSRYPRSLEADLEMCLDAGVALVFAPTADEMYPAAARRVLVDVPALTDTLEGALRPGHFAGVCQIVSKLFGVVRPDLACFGEKDFQQLAVIRAMVRGLDSPIEIVGCPTLRDADGLAMSSRNRFLSADERRRGLAIPRALTAARAAFDAGERDAATIRSTMRSILEDAGAVPAVPTRLDYATIVDADTLAELDRVDRPARALIAMRVGTTRLIDNAAIGD